MANTSTAPELVVTKYAGSRPRRRRLEMTAKQLWALLRRHPLPKRG